jgi:sodium-coupled neutral amino acid transporter 9
VHFKPNEIDFPDAIKRILGNKWFIAYNACSFLLMYLVGMIYFTLVCNMLYPFLNYILTEANVQMGSIDEIVFDKFSYQYVGIIMVCVFFFFFCMKDLSILLKLGQYGIVPILVFIGYIIVRGFINIGKGNVNTNTLQVFTSDVANLCGIFALSFFVHNIIIPILKNNKEEKKNQRDVFLGYSLTAGVYTIIGFFGAFAIAGVTLANGKTGNTVFDYFTPDPGTAILEILLFLQLATVLPIIWYNYFIFFYFFLCVFCLNFSKLKVCGENTTI